jgi:hypothetical protein
VSASTQFRIGSDCRDDWVLEAISSFTGKLKRSNRSSTPLPGQILGNNAVFRIFLVFSVTS